MKRETRGARGAGRLRAGRVALAIGVGLGLLVAASYVSTVRVADGDFQAALVHVVVVDAATGAPVEGARVRGRRDETRAEFFELPSGDATDREGNIDVLMPALRYGYRGWDFLWLVWIGSDRTRWAMEFARPGYVGRTVPLEAWDGRDAGPLRVLPSGMAVVERRVTVALAAAGSASPR